jgi:hypothetical protein
MRESADEDAQGRAPGRPSMWWIQLGQPAINAGRDLYFPIEYVGGPAKTIGLDLARLSSPAVIVAQPD